MPTSAPSLHLGVPGKGSLGILAINGSIVAYFLAWFWGSDPEYFDRFLIILASLWAVYQQWPTLKRAPRRARWIGLVPLLLGVITFPVGLFVLTQVGVSRAILLWWLVIAWILQCMGIILLFWGYSCLRKLCFPLFFVLLALPMPHRIQKPLQNRLQELATTCAEWGLQAVGIPVTRNQFELSLPGGGGLEVVEACSGIRSITALTAIACFVAYFRGMTALRALAFLLATFPVIAICNFLRIWITGIMHVHFGHASVEGVAHDTIGLLMVLLGLGTLLGLAWLIQRNPPRETVSVADVPSESATQLATVWPALGFLLLGLFGCIYAVHRARELTDFDMHRTPALDELPLSFGKWTGNEVPIPPDLQRELRYDRAIYRIYADDQQQEIHVWIFFWQGTGSILGYHHPDVCLPNRGVKIFERKRQNIEVETGSTIEVISRKLTHAGKRRLVLYWTQEGNRIWTDEDEESAMKDAFAHDWFRYRVIRPASERQGRLTVLINAPLWGSGRVAENETLTFTSGLVNALYRLMPEIRP